MKKLLRESAMTKLEVMSSVSNSKVRDRAARLRVNG